jgi:hypothetical protein
MDVQKWLTQLTDVDQNRASAGLDSKVVFTLSVKIVLLDTGCRNDKDPTFSAKTLAG